MSVRALGGAEILDRLERIRASLELERRRNERFSRYVPRFLIIPPRRRGQNDLLRFDLGTDTCRSSLTGEQASSRLDVATFHLFAIAQARIRAPAFAARIRKPLRLGRIHRTRAVARHRRRVRISRTIRRPLCVSVHRARTPRRASAPADATSRQPGRRAAPRRAVRIRRVDRRRRLLTHRPRARPHIPGFVSVHDVVVRPHGLRVLNRVRRRASRPFVPDHRGVSRIFDRPRHRRRVHRRHSCLVSAVVVQVSRGPFDVRVVVRVFVPSSRPASPSPRFARAARAAHPERRSRRSRRARRRGALGRRPQRVVVEAFGAVRSHQHRTQMGVTLGRRRVERRQRRRARGSARAARHVGARDARRRVAVCDSAASARRATRTRTRDARERRGRYPESSI